MNKIITTHVTYRGKSKPVSDLKDNSNLKVTVECVHGQREVKWSRRQQLCRKCAAHTGAYNTSTIGRKIPWGDKISKAKTGVKFSDAHKKALSIAQYKTSESEWPGFYNKSDIHKMRDSQEYIDFRQKVLKRDEYKCCISGKQGHLEVHHINSVNINKERIFDVTNGITLHVSLHSTFHLRYGSGNNNAEQLEEFKKDFHGRKQKLIFLCGQSGAGKTTIAGKVYEKFNVVHYDRNRKNLIEHLVTIPLDKPILLDIPALISTYYKKLCNEYNIEMVFIIEPIEVIEERIIARGGKITNSINSRYKRMQSLSKKYATFIGSADKVYKYLSELKL